MLRWVLPRRFGFVTFEKKDDAQRALSMCRQNQFLIGSSPMPALVETARIEVCCVGLQWA